MRRLFTSNVGLSTSKTTLNLTPSHLILIAGFFVLSTLCIDLQAQDSHSVSKQIEEHLGSGEFPKAIELATQLKTIDSDRWLKQIALKQIASGAESGAYKSAGMIGSDEMRTNTLEGILGNGQPAGAGQGNRGGVSEADFEPLMNLIQSVIAPDDWEETNGDGTIQAYPSGVYVDAKGTLHRLSIDKSKQLNALQRNALFDSGNRSATVSSELRKVSITRLERMAQLNAVKGLPVDPEMQNMAGIYAIEYLMVYPETGDIVIAGPAGPWELNENGRPVNQKTGKPVLQLDDLVVCLRNAWDNDGKFGCAITPRKQNLAETKGFLATSKLKGKAWRRELRKVLGQQDVEVFGIDGNTHTGKVLVEADYRMKLAGMGLEPTIPEVPSYLDRVKVKADGTIEGMTVARWWFTLNYDSVTTNEPRETFTFSGSGVKVLSENEMVNDIGERIHTGKSQGPTKEFARDFTRHFSKMADTYPVYAQLKNVFDVALVASLIKNEGLADRADWNLTYFGSPQAGQTSDALCYRVRTDRVADQVESVMNHREIKTRSGNKTLKHTIVGVSGGIAYDARLVSAKVKVDSNSGLSTTAKVAKPQVEIQRWWWD